LQPAVTPYRRVLALAGVVPVPAAALAALVGRLNACGWDALLADARAAGLAATVEAHLHARGLLPALPPGVAAALLDDHRGTLLSQAWQGHALTGIGAALDRAGIPFRLLKGPALAALAYPDPTTRAAVDLDLWVRPADRERACAVLEGCGLARLTTGPHPPAFLETFGTELQFGTAPGAGVPVVVDLHWHLLAPWWMRRTLRIPEAALFAHAAPVEIAGQCVSTLAPTETLYYLCLHAAINHRCAGLRLYADLGLLARSPAIDWPRLRALAAASGTAVILWRCFAILDALLGSAYGARLDRPPAPWHRAVLRRLVPGPAAGRRDSGGEEAPAPLYQVALLPGVGAMLAGMARLLWPPAAWIRLRYGPLPPGGVLRGRMVHLARLWGPSAGR
jgi:hypothetical protein